MMLSLLGGAWLALLTVIVLFHRHSEPAYYLGVSIGIATSLGLLFVGLSTLRSYTVKLWPDKVTYYHFFGRLSVAKRDITSVGYDNLPRSNNPMAFLAEKRYRQPRLYLRLRDGQVVWLEEFWVPPPPLKTGSAWRLRTEQEWILERLNKWLTSPPGEVSAAEQSGGLV